MSGKPGRSGAPRGNGNGLRHGRRALESLVRRGLDEQDAMAALVREREQGYLVDVGGAEAASEMEKSLCRRLAILDLDLALITARLPVPSGTRVKRVPWARMLAVMHARAANTQTFTLVASRLGIRRRPRDLDTDPIEAARRMAREDAEARRAQEAQGNGTREDEREEAEEAEHRGAPAH